MNLSRLRAGEVLAGIAGIALFAFMFLDWFGTSGPELPEVPGIENAPGVPPGLGGDTVAILAAMGSRLNLPVPRGSLAIVLGEVSAVLILWKIFDPPGDADLKIGVYLGLAASLAIALGAYLAMRDRGTDVLVPEGEPGGGRRL
jgi:hypothetical protein